MREIDYRERFGGVARLYGERGAQRLRAAHFVVVGVGGVGSWAVEALLRTDVGRLTIVDGDTVAESNTNRQIEALGGTYGQPKVLALRDRAAEINPRCALEPVHAFVGADNVAEIIPPGAVVIECIDQVRAKAAVVAHCVAAGIPIYTSGAAGGRTDPGRVRVEDVARAAGDPLVARLRHRLRKEYGFPDKGGSGAPRRFGVLAVFSDEPVKRADDNSGFGTGVATTATMGMRLASLAINAVAGTETPKI